MNFFAHARTALKFGLINLKLKPGDYVLVPAYSCDALIQPLRDLNLKIEFYSIDEFFNPKWEELEKRVKEVLFSAIIMIHYFGIPQDIKKFKEFSDRNNLFLIEDNAHGFGGTVDGKFLGTFGDIGISSPRKTLDLNSGGILYLKSKITYPKDLPIQKNGFVKNFLREFFSKNPFFKKILYKLKNNINFDDPSLIKETQVVDMLSDHDSSNKIGHSLVKKTATQIQMNQYKKWALCYEIFKREGFKPAVKKIPTTASPWLFPIKIDNEEEKKKLIKFSNQKNLIIVSWPILPKEIIVLENEAKKKWRKILFIQLNNSII